MALAAQAFESSHQQVQISSDKLQLALEHDSEFFLEYFISEIEPEAVPIPEFHVDCFNLMVNREVDRVCEAIPRDFAKTTLAKLAVVWHFVFTKTRFCVYLSNVHDTLAVPSCLDIIGFMEGDNFRATFGPLDWSDGIRQEGKGFYKFRLPWLNKVCMLKAHGAGQQVRGLNIDNQRPDLAILDDIESDQNTATEQLFEQTKRWLYGPFFKALDKFGHKIIQIGNIVNRLSILDQHCRSNYWHSRRYGCILSDGQPLWGSVWTLEALKLEFQRYQEQGLTDIWFAEMMNIPLAPGGGIIKANEINYKPHRLPEDCSWGFLTVDLAISEKEWAHRTVVVAHGWIEEEEQWQAVEYQYWKGINPIQLFHEIIKMMFTWKFFICGIESVAYQASLQYVFEHLKYAELTDDREILDNIKFFPLHAIGRKNQRIVPWAGMCKQTPHKRAQYALNAGDFIATQQLLSYDPTSRANDDDIIDAMAYAPQMIQNYFHEIINQLRDLVGSADAVATTYQVSPI